jgi:sugar-phosphatase
MLAAHRERKSGILLQIVVFGGGRLPVSIRCRGVLFDMDGVLISSTAADERTWLRWARLRGMENSFSIQATHGRRSVDTLRALRPDLDAEQEALLLEELDAEEMGGVVRLPGVAALLAAIPDERRAVVTSASTRLMQNRLGAAGLALPRYAITADMVAHGKPHPEPYQRGAAMLGLVPADCLVIEDAPAGIASGRAAGCRVLGVLTSHTADELQGADWQVASLSMVRAEVQEDGWIEIDCNE